MSDFQIEVKGVEKLVANLDKFGKQILANIGAAGQEAAEDVIFPTEGVRKYPPPSEANEPPPPYYIRGRGEQLASGNRYDSERYGTQFTSKRRGMDVILGNRASYAPYLGGEKQAGLHEKRGWRKLKDVAEEKIEGIKARYQAWIEKTIRDLGL